MRYYEPEALELIRQKGREIRKRRERKRSWLLGSLSGALTLLLLVFLADAMPHVPVSASEASNMGSFLLRAENGAFVFVAVIAFVLGVLITLLCVHRQRLKALRRQNEENPDPIPPAIREESQPEPGAGRIFTNPKGGNQE